jgi:hypothetical protein
MCDPLTIAGIALTAGSTAVNTIANNKVNAARSDALTAERIRQNGLDQEAKAVNAKSEDSYKDFSGQQDQAATDLGDYFTGQNVAEPAADAALPTSASNITVREEAKQRGQAQDFTDKTGSALGQLRSFGDVLGDKSREQARAAGLIGQLGGFKQGSSGALNYELDSASHAGDGLKTFGDILGGVGGLTTKAGLAGKVAAPTSLGGVIGYTAPTNTYPTAPTSSIGSSLSRLFGGV